MLQRRDPPTPVPSSDPTERTANLPLPLRQICRGCTLLYHIETMPAVLTTCPGPVQQKSPNRRRRPTPTPAESAVSPFSVCEREVPPCDDASRDERHVRRRSTLPARLRQVRQGAPRRAQARAARALLRRRDPPRHRAGAGHRDAPPPADRHVPPRHGTVGTAHCADGRGERLGRGVSPPCARGDPARVRILPQGRARRPLLFPFPRGLRGPRLLLGRRALPAVARDVPHGGVR